MSRKDFQLIADALRGRQPSQPAGAKWAQWVHDCLALADALRSSNPRLDRGRFLRACGVELDCQEAA